MRIVVTGSIAFDYLMSFPGQFTEHLLPDHLDRLSLSFLVDSMDKRRGGCAPNIAYTLALLGERPVLMATAGEDFDEYRIVARGGRRRHVARAAGGRQVHRVVFLQHGQQQQPDCVVLHGRHGRRWASCRFVPFTTAAWRSSRRTILARWCSTRTSAARSGIRYIFDPGQQCARMSGDELKEGVIGATILICNDYEFEIFKQKTGLDERRHPGAHRSAHRHARRARIVRLVG